MPIQNTGYQQGDTLEQYYTDTYDPAHPELAELPGVEKPNTPDDPDYIAPVYNPAGCSTPPGSADINSSVANINSQNNGFQQFNAQITLNTAATVDVTFKGRLFAKIDGNNTYLGLFTVVVPAGQTVRKNIPPDIQYGGTGAITEPTAFIDNIAPNPAGGKTVNTI